MILTGENLSILSKTCHSATCAPQFSNELTWYRTRSSDFQCCRLTNHMGHDTAYESCRYSNLDTKRSLPLSTPLSATSSFVTTLTHPQHSAEVTSRGAGRRNSPTTLACCTTTIFSSFCNYRRVA